MRTSKTIVFGLLAAVVAAMAFGTDGGITSAYAQASNVTSSKAAALSSMQGTVIRDSVVILLEGKTLPANDFKHLYDTTPYMIRSGHIAAKLPYDAS